MWLEVTLWAADILTDLIGGYNYIKNGHYWFGGITLGIWAASGVKHLHKLPAILRMIDTSAKQGYYVDELLCMLQDEVRFEGVAGLMLNTYGLPFAVSDRWSLCQQLVSIALSARGVAKVWQERQMGAA